jgi:hypothetical protein
MIQRTPGSERSRIVAATLAVAVLLCSWSGSGAALSMGVSPMKLHLTIEPGGRETVAVQVYNTDEVPIRVVTQQTDWITTIEGEMDFLPPGTVERSASAWVQADLSEFSLPAGGNQIVRISAGLPDTARGSYWTLVFFEGQGEVQRGRIGLGAKARMGVTIYLTAAGTQELEFDLTGMDTLPDERGQAFELSASIANRGNVHRYPTGWFQVLDPDGRTLIEEEAPLRVLLPGQEVIYRLSWQPHAPGRHQLVATFDCGVESLIQGIKDFEVGTDAIKSAD